MSKYITITSKNQITIPAKIARQLGVNKGDRLEIKLRNKQLVLSKPLSLTERLQPVWDQVAAIRGGKPAPTDDEIKAWLRHEGGNNL